MGNTSAFRSSHASTFTVCVALLSALCSYPALMGDYMALGDKALVEDMHEAALRRAARSWQAWPVQGGPQRSAADHCLAYDGLLL